MKLCRKEPRDDLITHLANGKIDGRPLTEHEIGAVAFNVLAGGVDTTTGLTTNTLLYLSRNPDKRQQLIDNPELLPKAREEFLRYFSPIHALSRNMSKDTEINGSVLPENERVLLCYASANRDEEIFEDPETHPPRPGAQPSYRFRGRSTPLHWIIFCTYDVRHDAH